MSEKSTLCRLGHLSSIVGADRSGFLRVRKGAEGALINIHTNEGA